MSTAPLLSFRTCSAGLKAISSVNTSVDIVEAILGANSEHGASVAIVRENLAKIYII